MWNCVTNMLENAVTYFYIVAAREEVNLVAMKGVPFGTLELGVAKLKIECKP